MKEYHVGVDLASATMGLAILTDTGNLKHISQHNTTKLSKTHTKWERYMILLSNFVEIIQPLQDDVLSIYVEGYGGNANVSSLIPAVECGTILRVLLERMNLMNRLVIIPPMSLKKFTTGKGNAKKDQMIAFVFKKYGFMAPDSDQADAYALAMMSIRAKNSPPDLTSYEKEVLKKLEIC